ncbi:synaptojanin-2-binding protein-like isoform X1 [Leucoraja erinacea]|uniref:synaptojanin-2-binding protein-like isoform X1 n=1 Tax=Leucoraja erinaceus TaxID=7782 RepID=UPI002455AC3D|nr:synaptojanin-2-binding protein-like isoform X1 [Leucoraja erinacea]
MAGRDGRDVSHIKTKSHFITLKKGRAGFGFNILGGIDKPCYPGNCGIYVAKIRENESAALDGRLREGDRILEAGGISLDNILHEDAAKVFRNTTNDALVLRIERQGEPDFGEEMSPSNKWSPSQTLQYSGKKRQKWYQHSRFHTARLPWIILASSVVTIAIVMGALKISAVKK